jgi:hypothetical protein
MILSTMLFPAIIISGLFYIFVIWVLWMIVKCLKGIDASLKEIAQSPDKV